MKSKVIYRRFKTLQFALTMWRETCDFVLLYTKCFSTTYTNINVCVRHLQVCENMQIENETLAQDFPQALAIPLFFSACNVVFYYIGGMLRHNHYKDLQGIQSTASVDAQQESFVAE